MFKKLFLFLFLLFSLPAVVFSQEKQSPYEISNFQAQVEINQDASITVEEKIAVSFNQPRHGIFRVIPVVYTVNGRTLRTNFNLISAADEQGNEIQVDVSSQAQSKRLRIGDPDQTVEGDKVYVITYSLDRVIRRYDDYDELYWNVTGAEWDVPIEAASVVVDSQYAVIGQTDCFAGLAGSKQQNCREVESSESQVKFSISRPVGQGRDFTVVIGLEKNNQLNFPGPVKIGWLTIRDNWGYAAAVMPMLVTGIFWWVKGRDKRFLSDNVYFRPEDKEIKTVNPLARPHLPMVYHPIDNLTPAQVGTIIDDQVNLRDVVAEIIELARLGCLEIERIRQKSIFKKDDYRLKKLKKADDQLADYQRCLFENLFDQGDKEVKISGLKNKFYVHLAEFKKKLYQSLVETEIFPDSPDKVRGKWFGIAIGLSFLAGFLVVIYNGLTANALPLLFAVPSIFIAFVAARFMPRKTAWGYSLFRQSKSLQWYLKKGKWRQEIAEKHLFLAEMLPLAISLGVVEQLAEDMTDLGVEPPDYVQGFTAAELGRQINTFNSVAAGSLSSNPSGKSSWSGGSGFSGGGGSSGGGMGGGGGGSW